MTHTLHYAFSSCMGKYISAVMYYSTVKYINSQTISGNVSILAGSGRSSTEDGIGVNASFNGPTGITINELTGDIYVTEYIGHVIRKIFQGIHIRLTKKQTYYHLS